MGPGNVKYTMSFATAGWPGDWPSPSPPRRSGAALQLHGFCGGHTHAISRYGVGDLLPAHVRMIHGPAARSACCRSAASTWPSAGAAARRDPVHLRRLPARAGLRRPVADEGQGRGGDVRMVYSSADALKIAQENPGRRVVFFAIGFETTTPPTAVVIKQAAALGPRQLFRCSAATC